MENTELRVSQKELDKLEIEIKNADIMQQDEKPDKVLLVLLYKLLQTEQKITKLEKYIMTPLIP